MTDEAFEKYELVWTAVHNLVDIMLSGEAGAEDIRDKLTNEFRFWKRSRHDIAAASEMIEQPASSAARTIEDCPELNMFNYDAVDVDRLNEWAIRADAEIDRLAALAQPAQEPWPDLTKRDRESYRKGHNDGVAHHKQAVKAAQPEQEPVNLLDARRIAAEYGTPDSQVDNGNLYFALSKCLEHIDAQPEQEQKCWCTTCRPITMSDMRFVVCPDCGNKRCPKSNDHRNACTGSNEVGQNGSSWEHVKPLAQPAQRTWVDPNDKTQKQYLPHIGELVLFCHGGKTYTGKHTGGSFQSEITNQYFNTWECRWMYLPAAHGIKEPKHYPHTWGKDGERCVVCGDKDWMGTNCKKISAPQPEQNFCPRCGKRTNDIHTCTPPQD